MTALSGTTARSWEVPHLEDLLPLEGKRVLLRVDYNVPLADGPAGSRVVVDDYRIRMTMPTINWLLEHGAHVTACSHLGRPKGKVDERYSMEPVRARLAELAPGVELLDNLRFDPGEEANDDKTVERLVAGHDCYVNDAFGAAHRAHASVVGPPRFLPSAAGRLLAREVEVLGSLLDAPKRPFVAVVGGAKVADKLGVLESLIARVDTLIVGGGMSYTFLAAMGHRIGASLFDESKLEACKALLDSGVQILLPADIVAISPDGKINFGGNPAVESLGSTAVVERDIEDGWEGVDIGPRTRRAYAEAISGAATLLWNGPMGAFEDSRFGEGTKAVAEAVAACEGFSVVGGGDSVAALDKYGLSEGIDHISTGGGASLEYLEKGDLPGLAALRAAVR
ncbi:MAG: phosphoglycerate kinase [Actinomycetota bacterium]|nr:phosphoglycerate kinase [Actinomycetota bacterium]